MWIKIKQFLAPPVFEDEEKNRAAKYPYHSGGAAQRDTYNIVTGISDAVAETIVTGISDMVAESIVELGIDWSEITTLSDLQSGLRVALNQLGLTLTRA